MISKVSVPFYAPLKKTSEELYPEIFQKDGGAQVERRIKVLTQGEDDTADPCIPVEITLPNGESICALYFSGGRVIHYKNFEELLRGGVRPFRDIEVLTREGHPLQMHPYHLAEAIWDTELIIYRDKTTNELRYVGHGGKMERVDREKPAHVAYHNYRRSRHAFKVSFDLDGRTNRLTEVWQSLGPIHGNKPNHEGNWIYRSQDQAHAHGYGSRMIRDENGQIWRDENGVAWMTYEEVTEEKVLPNGTRLPYGTKIFARAMNDNLTLACGEPVLLSSYTPWSDPHRPFKAAMRRDAERQNAGYLVEGPNPILLKVDGKFFWTIFFSAGDFVSDYGNFMMVREQKDGPIGPYDHVTNSDNELIDLTADIVSRYDLTWAGRLNCFYDDQGKLWGLMHGIFKVDLPDDWVKNGWPRSQEEFVHYARRTILVPLEAELIQGKPVVRASINA